MTASVRRFVLFDEEAMQKVLNEWAKTLKIPGVVYLTGPLGAGKTTWVRCLLRALGYQGAVRSPTYTLMEVYTLETMTVVHADWYRLESHESLDYTGLDTYLDHALCCFEWPDHLKEALPKPSVHVHLDYLPGEVGRVLVMETFV